LKDERSSSPGFRLATFFLNVQFFTLLPIFVVVGIPSLTLFVAASRLFLSHQDTLRLFRRAIRWFGWVIIRVLPFPWVSIRYRDLAPGAKAPLLFVSNHRSFSDGFLMALLPEHGVQIVNTWPFRIPILGFFARGAGYISIREMPIEEFYSRAGKLLEEGASIACFPEGTRSGSRRMGPFHGSVFRLALQTKTPIVPLCISGNEDIPARGSLVLHPGVITVQRLPPIHPEQHQDLSAFQFKTKVRATMARELAAMDGVPPEEGEAGEPAGPQADPAEADPDRSGSSAQT